MTVFTKSIETKAESRLGFVDITDDLQSAINESAAADGIVVAFCRHTTCVLVINEWEQGAHEDAARTLEALSPAATYYAHDDMTRRTQNLLPDERANGQAHALATLLGGTNQVIPFTGGEITLGRWQRLMLLELDDPRPREVIFSILI